MSVITAIAATDSVINAFDDDDRVESWVDETDKEVIMISESLGVLEADINKSPLHQGITKFAKAYYSMIVCRDNIGVNNVETPADEKYRIKYDMYDKLQSELKQRLTKEMFFDEDGELEANETVSSGILYLG